MLRVRVASALVRARQVRVEVDGVDRVGGVGIGWAKVIREAKVRASKSRGSDVVATLHEGAQVLVEEVSSKAARIHTPFAGWIALTKASGPVLEQDSCNRRGPGEKSATQWVVDHTLARLRAVTDVPTVEDVPMPSEMLEHPLECPELATDPSPKRPFTQLPSVATWLVATPPISAGAADAAFPNPAAAADPSFAHLPSVGTWLASASVTQRLVPLLDQAAFAQPHSVAPTEPPLAQPVRPICAFTQLPSVATWLATKPAPGAADVPAFAEPTQDPSPESTSLGDWWIAFCNSLQQTLCCGRGKWSNQHEVGWSATCTH